MENFRIDFTLSDPFPDGKKLGECGEKNAAQLIITPPENLASREEIRFYVVAFSTEKGPVRYGPVPKSETVTVPVSNALTVGTALSVQVEGYDADGEFIIKSPVLSGIVVSNSISDGNCGNSDDKSVIPGHIHENLELLNSFSESDGLLMYKDYPVFDKNTSSLRTVVLDSLSGEFSVFTDTPCMNCIVFIANRISDSEFSVPDGVVIKSIEVNTSSADNPVWIDLHDTNDAQSFVPYVVNIQKSLYSDLYNGIILGTVYFPFMVNDFYPVAANYEINSIRVTYEESGEN